ncbi:origin of replication complex subunit 5 isoform X1 [Carica papaya]|uniref:origin of replication complex subunit 5 isoform X1 n=1 Tax=Carica papaya TaxID=3649 RepID=UPI000B8CF3B0|nr:origin of replication complex subunit 5 isoform X1 [Carica papaya]XP_021906201.1 origin of replication complex subunit 5 isoform X1 [Carica papaya]
MSNEGTPQITRRTTRSSSAAVSINAAETSKTRISNVPTINDLAFDQEPINKDDLFSSFPGRRTQILELLHLLGPSNSPMLPIFIYGAASTGKTSIILQVFRHLKRPFVYSSCISCYSPRILFESILDRLLLHKKSDANGYSSAKRCEKPADFVNFLREALINIINNINSNSVNLSSDKLAGRPNGKMIYLIFDNLELVRDWDKSSTMLPFLFNLHNILKMPEVGLIYVSGTTPDTYYSSMGYIEPIPVYFPDYTEDALREIFMRNQANRKLYSSFLNAVLRPFCRVTRRVDALSIVFSSLYKVYCEPLKDLGIVPNEDMKRRLFAHLQPRITPFLNGIFRVPSQTSVEVEGNKKARWKNDAEKSICEGFEKVDFHMSASAKYLLISAFLASRNPATLDASMFDSTGGCSSHKRKRKASEKSMEQKEIAEQELLMRGPGTFPLERLLAIFQCITSVAEYSSSEEEEGSNGLGVEGSSSELMSDVLLQLSSLCNANFVTKGGNCPLEGSIRYRSTVSEELAMKVARSLRFPLSKYLYRR